MNIALMAAASGRNGPPLSSQSCGDRIQGFRLDARHAAAKAKHLDQAAARRICNFVAGLDDLLDAVFLFRIRKNREAVFYDLDRGVEQFVGGAAFQPLDDLAEWGRISLNA